MWPASMIALLWDSDKKNVAESVSDFLGFMVPSLDVSGFDGTVTEEQTH